jgi:hypothetical protein
MTADRGRRSASSRTTSSPWVWFGIGPLQDSRAFALSLGPYGAAGAKRYDVLGRAVNVTAGLEGSGVTLSVEAFRRLGSELRGSFKKHTPPITYIRLQDQRVRRG